MKPFRSFLAVVVLGAVLVAGCSSQSGSGTAAQIGATVITVSTVQRELNAFKSNPGFGSRIMSDGVMDPEFVASWMSSDIESVLIAEFLDDNNITVPNTTSDRARASLKSRFGQDAAGGSVFDAFPVWFQNNLVQRQANAEAALQYYVKQDAATYFRNNEKKLTDACPSKKVLRHILVKTQAEADQVLAQLAAGADFATLASKLSIDTSSGGFGGLLGCYEAGSFIEAFEAVANTMTIGSRAVATTQYGVHVIEMLGLSETSLAVEIDRALRSDASAQLQQYLTGQIESRPTRVNPRFGVLEISENSFVAPTGQSAAPRVRTEPAPANTNPLTLTGR